MQGQVHPEHSVFKGSDGAEEHFFCFTADPSSETFERQLTGLQLHYQTTLALNNLSPDTAVFQRFFLSDVLNQAPLLETLWHTPALVARSVIEQQPLLPQGKLALLAYHVRHPQGMKKEQPAPGHFLISHGESKILWSVGLRGTEGESAADQTLTVLQNLHDMLASQQANLLNHCLRTWIYVKDIDTLYQDMVKARTPFFAKHGLNKATHYPAGTSNQAYLRRPGDLIEADALSYLSVRPEQISYPLDPAYLCQPQLYNITFERCIRVAFKDRAHLIISGTPAVDNSGIILHQGDVRRQTGRMLENIFSLIRAGGGVKQDLKYLIVYLRDLTDTALIKPVLQKELPDVPCLFIRSAVCRPGWLVEAEGLAISPLKADNLPHF